VCGEGRWKHLAVSDIVKEKGYHGGVDAKYDTLLLDEDGEDRLLDELEEELAGGGRIVEYHSSELFPERWFDLVVCLRCESTEVLYGRLERRGYSSTKLQENVSAEIMGVCLEEAREAYPTATVVELPSMTPEDVKSNAARMVLWRNQWKLDNPEGGRAGGSKVSSELNGSSSGAVTAVGVAPTSSFALGAGMLSPSTFGGSA
jgi:adenylate kinase